MELPQGTGRVASYIVQSGALQTPIVIVDVGARGGLDGRWKPIEKAIEVYGFDPSTTVEPATPAQHFFKIAISDKDGDMPFRFAANRFESKYDSASNDTVPASRLDTLFSSGKLPKADFLKIDVEGYEPSVLDGAVQYLRASELLAADVETNFNISDALPDSHFHAITSRLRLNGLRLANLAMQSPAGHPALPWPGVCNAFYCRDLMNGEADIQRILKLLVILDLYRMTGHMRELAALYRAAMPRSIDQYYLSKILTPSRSWSVESYLPRFDLGLWTWFKSRVYGSDQS